MKKVFLLSTLVMWSIALFAVPYNVTFRLNTNEMTQSFTTPAVNGTFNAWCGACNNLSDADMDGIWETTLSLEEGSYEYKFTIDGWSGEESLTPGSSCTATNGGFTNRMLNFNSDVVLDIVCWNSCSNCTGVVLSQMDLPVTFEDPSVEYGLVGFGGAENSAIVEDPTDMNNTVARVVKSGTAELWAGTTITNVANEGFATAIPFSPSMTTMTVRVWSPLANIPVRLKVENAANPGQSVETEAMVTTANEWQTLTFDFSNEAGGTAALNYTLNYNKASIFFNFGVTGAISGEQTYYFDDVMLGEEVINSYDVTFNVDMNESGATFTTVHLNGTFNEWCGACIPMTDEDNDNVWTVTLNLQQGSYEYKFTYDGWTGDEQLTPGSSCTVTNGGFTNRSLNLTENTTLPTVCWASCEACGFVQMNQMDLPVTFDLDNVEYGLVGFGGAENSTIVEDPTDMNNTVARVVKSGTAELWAGTTITNAANEGFASAIPFTANLTTMTVRVWSPLANIPVRLKVEDYTNPGISVETEAMVTVANEWQTLTFDFANQASGTAALNLANFYNKASIFFNFGTTGAISGEQTYYFDDVKMGDVIINNYDVTFSVDMNESGATFTTVHLNGTFNEWCGACNPMSDTDGDNIWTVTLNLPQGAHEYKFTYDGWTGDEQLTPGSPCTVNNGGFTNRSLNLTGNTVLPTVCWASCTACGFVQLDQMDLPVTFELENVEYGLIGFGGADDSAIEVDPTDANNMVARVIKSATAELWAGTTVTNANGDGLANVIPFTSENTTMTVRVWSPVAGIPVRLKVEDHTDPTHSVETEASTTVAGEWETLTFDFANEAVGTAPLNLAYSFDKASIFFDFGTTGAQVGEARTYYFDDIMMGEGGGGGDTFNVTFQVDMNTVLDAFTTPEVNGNFNGWCGGCAPMSDVNADGIWELTIALAPGTYEYKFAYDNWTGQENLLPGMECTLTTGQFTNRLITVSEDVTLDPVCWGSCAACGNGPFQVTFKVDMANVTETFTTPEINGTFNNWCGGCAPMTDANADGVWEITIPLMEGTYEYKFAYDSWAGQESLTPGSPCTSTIDGFTNRTIDVTENAILSEVCWASCDVCDPDNVGEMNVNTISMYPNPAGQQVTIQGWNTNENVVVSIYNGVGSLVYQVNNNNAALLTLPTEGFANGIYTVVVKSQDAIIPMELMIQH